jgi:hypothetical protein
MDTVKLMLCGAIVALQVGVDLFFIWFLIWGIPKFS